MTVVQSVPFQLVDDLETLSAERIHAIQRHNFLATISVLQSRGMAGNQWSRTSTMNRVEDIEALPLLSPKNLEDMCPPKKDLVLDSMRTGLVLRSSGTSGKQKLLYHSWEFNERVAFLGARGLRAAVADCLPVRIANCLYPAELNGAFSFVNDVTRVLGAQAFPVGTSMDMGELVEIIADHEIDTLVGSPAFGADLVAHTKNYSRLRSLRNFLFIGENMGKSREAMMRATLPGVRIKSLSYSTSETGPIGYQCQLQTGSTHHIHEDAVLVEVVDGSGIPVPQGTEGEIIVSTLSTTGMPLLRYQVGDRGILLSPPCACGSNTAQLTLMGRVEQSLNIDGATISQELIMAQLAILGITDPLQCQFHVNRYNLSFTISLLVSDQIKISYSSEEMLASLKKGYHLGRVFAMPGYQGFKLRRVPLSAFIKNRRGKTPFFVER